jgi:hypothetical protein
MFSTPLPLPVRSPEEIQMSILKLRRGVLRVKEGERVLWVRPSAWQRLHLLWLFRNFTILSASVLSARQQELIGRMRRRERVENAEAELIIGTIEYASVNARKPAASDRRATGKLASRTA